MMLHRIILSVLLSPPAGGDCNRPLSGRFLLFLSGIIFLQEWFT